MRSMKPFCLFAAAVLATGCDMKIGNDANSGSGGNVSAAGKSKEGQMSVSAPGFEMKFDIPEGLQAKAGMNDDSGLIYPNARFSGIHVEGGSDSARGGSTGEVELRFSSSDSPDLISRWYRDPARAADFTVASAGREGDALVLAGTRKEDDGRFSVRLSPGSNGGTDGRVVLSDGS